MVIYTRSWKMWLVGMFVSLAIFGVLYFTVIRPSADTANQAIRTGMQETQQALTQAQQQVSSSAAALPAGAGQAKAATGQAQQVVNRAAKIAACVQAAGTDAGKLQACQTQFGH